MNIEGVCRGLGEPDEYGVVVDLAVLRERIYMVRRQLDHQLPDHVPGLGVATLEALCTFVANRLKPEFPNLCAVRVWREGSGDSLIWRGDSPRHYGSGVAGISSETEAVARATQESLRRREPVVLRVSSQGQLY
jgi:6-pyruvoyl-tetrahydropterin synthase